MTTLKARVNGQWVPVSGGGGGGTDEVWIGPDDPIAAYPATELWYDTDDEPEAVDQANFWNSAWGVVVVGSFIASGAPWGLPVDVQTKVAALNYTTVVGRRYRLTLVVRVTNSGMASTQGSANILWYGSGVPATDSWSYIGAPGYYSAINQQVVFDGTGVASAYEAAIRPLYVRVDAWTNLGSAFYLEDIGPVTKAAVNPPAGQPTIATAGNALGVIAVGSGSGGGNIPTNTEKTVTSTITCYLATGRRYRATMNIRAVGATGATAAISCLYGVPGGPIGDRYIFIGGNFDGARETWLFNGDGANHSLYAALKAQGTALDVFAEYNTDFYIEDVGPNSAPALPIPETPAAWNVATLQNGWANMGYDYPLAGYRKIGDEVQLHGLVTGGSQGSDILTLPVGFRSPKVLHLATATNDLFGIVRVNLNGTLTATVTSGGWFSLDNIRFSVTP